MIRILKFAVFALLFSGYLGAQTILVSEDFEGGVLPTNWSRQQDSSSIGWEFGGSLGTSFCPIPNHTKYAASNDDAHDDNSFQKNKAHEDYLLTPVMDLRPFNTSGVVLTFEYAQPGTWNSVGTVEVTTDGGNNWTVVDSLPSTEFWKFRFVNLSGFTNDSTVQVGFHHNDQGKWADGFAIDDVEIKSVPPIDAAVVEVDFTEYIQAGLTPIAGTIMNYGHQTITSLDLSYSINGSGAVTDNITGLGIPLGGSYSFSHLIPANLTVPGLYTVIVWVSNVNSGVDSVTSNDTIIQKVKTVSTVPGKTVVLETHVSASDGYTPDALYKMSSVLMNHSNAIAVAIHDNDALEIGAGNMIEQAFINNIPSGTVDRLKFDEELNIEIPRHKWSERVGARLQEIVPVSVGIENLLYDPANRTVTFDVKANFFGNVEGDVRLNAWIIENEIVGSGNGWDQRNYYSYAGSAIGGPNHYYYGYLDPITNFAHEHVLRNALDGPWGDVQSVSTPAIDGDSAVKQYNYVLPATWDEMNIRLLAMVQRYDTSLTDRIIYNADLVQLSTVIPVGIDNDLSNGFAAYPNPFSDRVEVDLPSETRGQIMLFDMSGRLVKSFGNRGKTWGGEGLVWDGSDAGGNVVPAGLYLMHLKVAGEPQTLRLIKH